MPVSASAKYALPNDIAYLTQPQQLVQTTQRPTPCASRHAPPAKPIDSCFKKPYVCAPSFPDRVILSASSGLVLRLIAANLSIHLIRKGKLGRTAEAGNKVWRRYPTYSRCWGGQQKQTVHFYADPLH